VVWLADSLAEQLIVPGKLADDRIPHMPQALTKRRVAVDSTYLRFGHDESDNEWTRKAGFRDWS
jgi:hypothetical protein